MRNLDLISIRVKKNTRGLILAIVVALLALSGCGGADLSDLQGVWRIDSETMLAELEQTSSAQKQEQSSQKGGKEMAALSKAFSQMSLSMTGKMSLRIGEKKLTLITSTLGRSRTEKYRILSAKRNDDTIILNAKNGEGQDQEFVIIMRDKERFSFARNGRGQTAPLIFKKAE